MLGNRALQAGVASVTATGNTTLGFAPGNTAPKDLIAVSASGAATIVLPVIALTGTTLGMGDAQMVRVVNLNSQSVALAAGGSDTIVGASGTIAANTAATLVSDAANNRWIRY
jgi:hypothetical protein